MRKLALVLALILVLCSCAQNSLPEESLPESSLPESSETEAEPDLELLQGDGTVLFYKYFEGGIYEAEEHFTPEGESKLRGIIAFAAKELLPEGELPKINSVKIEKEYLTLDFSGDWLDYGKRDFENFLNSLATTIFQNTNVYSAGFSIDGDFGTLGGEPWEPAPLKMSAGTAEEFSAIRLQIPFSGTNSYDPFFVLPAMKENELAAEVYSALEKVLYLGEDFDDPKERNMKDSVFSAIHSIKYMSVSPAEETYDERLLPIAASVSEKLPFPEEMFWLKEHVEESARLLYGDDFTLEHQSVNHFEWYETEGIYAPPHMGGGNGSVPIVTACSEEENVVTAEFVYLLTDSGFGIWDEAMEKDFSGNEEAPDYDAIYEYAENSKTRHRAVFNREADGRLVLKSHHMI